MEYDSIKNPAMQRGIGAFSLVELLVSIAIVLVLASLVIGFSGTVRKSLKAAQCTSNLRQLMPAFSAYAADNNGFIKFHFYSTPGSTKRWIDFLIEGRYLDAHPPGAACPATAPFVYGPSGYCYGGIGQGAAGDPFSQTLPGAGPTSRGIRLSVLAEPSKYWLLADSWSSTYKQQIYFINTASSTNGMHFRHKGKANMLFADGHVEALTPKEVKNLPLYPLSWGFNEDGLGVTF